MLSISNDYPYFVAASVVPPGQFYRGESKPFMDRAHMTRMQSSLSKRDWRIKFNCFIFPGLNSKFRQQTAASSFALIFGHALSRESSTCLFALAGRQLSHVNYYLFIDFFFDAIGTSRDLVSSCLLALERSKSPPRVGLLGRLWCN